MGARPGILQSEKQQAEHMEQTAPVKQDLNKKLQDTKYFLELKRGSLKLKNLVDKSMEKIITVKT